MSFSEEKIRTIERIVIDASNSTRYLGYPRKVPIWEIKFLLLEYITINRNKENSDIFIEIENKKGLAIVPALSHKESIERLKTLIPQINNIISSNRL